MSGKIEAQSNELDKHSGDATCLVYYNEFLYSGGADGKIKIWNNDIELQKTANAHDSYIYAIAINSKGHLYSSSCDGKIKCFPNIMQSDDFILILENNNDEIITLVIDTDDTLYTGDDKGVVTKWTNNKIVFKYNLVEEVRSMAIEKNLLYTVRDLDVCVTDLLTGPTGRYITKATFPGKCPLLLFGPIVNEKRKYLAVSTRDGKGITLHRNLKGFPSVWVKEDAHEMIIITMCASDSELFSAGYDGKVKKWVELENVAQNVGEVTIGSFVNAICLGYKNSLFVADTTGIISRVSFSTAAA